MKGKRLMSVLMSMLLLCGMYTSGINANSKSRASEQSENLPRKAASEGIVLLENRNDVLPIKEANKKIAVFGMNQLDYIPGGGGSANVNSEYTISLVDSLKIMEQEGKIEMYKPLLNAYETAFKSDKSERGRKAQIQLDTEMVDGAVSFADTAIISIGRFQEEGSDVSVSKNHNKSGSGYYLSVSEKELIDKVTNAGFSKVILVLNISAVMDSSWFKDESSGIDAVLVAWLPGMEGGNAMTDIIFCNTNPSGKLADTFVSDYSDYLSSEGFDSDSFQEYQEDIYLGYRYFETIPGASEKVNYPFGYGLSYTTFDIETKEAAASNGVIEFKVDVKNTGDTAGKEVVQIYFSAPQGVLGKPARELAAFAKTKELAPGETQSLTLSLNVNDMASYDDMGKTAYKSSYVLEAGEYKFYVGNSVRESYEYEFKYILDSDVQVQQLSEKLAPKNLEKRLNSDGTYEYLIVDQGPVLEIPSQGSVAIDVKDYYQIQGGEARYMEGDGNIGYFGKDCAVSFKFNVQEEGVYEVKMDVATERNATDAFRVYVNESRQNSKVDISSTGGWGVYQEQTFDVVLYEGEVIFKIINQTEDFNFRNIVITKKGSYDYITHDISNGPVTFNAKDYYRIISNRYPDVDTHVGGGGNISYFESGNRVQYKLNVAEAGTYRVVINAASERTTSNPFTAYINGNEQPYVDLNFNTGGWGEYRDFEFELILEKGINLFEIKNNEAAFDFKTFTFTKKSTPVQISARVLTEFITLSDVYNEYYSMENFLEQMTDRELAVMAHGIEYRSNGTIGRNTRLGIQGAAVNDGPAGLHLNHKNTTYWPCATLLASSFNTDLVEEIGKITAQEALDSDMDGLLAPSLNIHRDPRNGRNFEYYSEDPLISGKMAAAFVRGAKSEGVLTTLKHFALNNKENNRRGNDSRVSERAAREIYLEGFRIAIAESDPAAIMTAYNPINGIKASQNKDLLTGILRNEWNYTGLTMSDWDSGADIVNEVLAGNNVKMPTGNADEIIAALNDSENPLTRSTLEENAKYILEFVMKSYKFLTEYANPDPIAIQDGTKFFAGYNIMGQSEQIRAQISYDTEYNNRLSLAWSENNEYVVYSIDVKESGIYNPAARIATERSDMGFDIYIDGQKEIEFRNPTPTASWETWKTQSMPQIELDSGIHEMKLVFNGPINLNWIDFNIQESPESEASSEIEASNPAESSEPEASNPAESSEPEASNPAESSEPETSNPAESSEPEASNPAESSEPEASNPAESSEPEASNPAVSSEPNISEPEASKPLTSIPDESNPSDSSESMGTSSLSNVADASNPNTGESSENIILTMIVLLTAGSIIIARKHLMNSK